MHLPALLLPALLFPLTALGAAQVNLYVHPFPYPLESTIPSLRAKGNPNTSDQHSYYDTTCNNYAGTSYAQNAGPVVGGPAGSKSMLFVTQDSCSRTCGKSRARLLVSCNTAAIASSGVLEAGIHVLIIAAIGPNLLFCKNPECSAWDKAAGFGQCKSYANGVWAREVCGCGY